MNGHPHTMQASFCSGLPLLPKSVKHDTQIMCIHGNIFSSRDKPVQLTHLRKSLRTFSSIGFSAISVPSIWEQNDTDHVDGHTKEILHMDGHTEILHMDEHTKGILHIWTGIYREYFTWTDI